MIFNSKHFSLIISLVLMLSPITHIYADEGKVDIVNVPTASSIDINKNMFKYKITAIINPSSRTVVKYQATNGRIEDQADTPWCTAYSVCGAVEAKMRAMGIPVPDTGFSEAWLYAKVEQINGRKSRGISIEDALFVAKTYGLCPNEICPTDNYVRSTREVILTAAMDQAAAQYKINDYSSVPPDLYSIKNSLVANGYLIIGSKVQRINWNDGDKFILPVTTQTILQHATYLTGYDDRFVFGNYVGFLKGVNSWGYRWGNHGTYDMAYDVIIKTRDVFEAWCFTVSV